MTNVVGQPGGKGVPRSSLILGAGLLVLLLAGASFVSMSNANVWLRHTDEARLRIALLRGTLLDAETGLRGYLLTGAPAFLDPYRQAEADWRGQLDEVRALTTDNPEQQLRIRSLEQIVTADFDGFSTARATGAHARATQEPLLSLLLAHKRSMDGARRLLAEMENEEVGLDRIRERAATRRWAWTAALLSGGALSFVALAGSMTAQRRSSERRRERAEDERRLLRGVFAGIDDGIILFDRTGDLIFANAGAARMTGFASPEALLAAPRRTIPERFDIRAEDGSPLPMENLPSRLVLAGRPTAQALIRHRAGAAALWRWSLVNAMPILDADGNVVQAISVFRDVTADREAQERQRFLLRAVDELSSSLDYERTLASVARLAVPTLADWCAVDIVDDGQLKRLATAHIDPQKVSAVHELARRYPPDPRSRTGVHEIIRTGKPQLVPEIPRELLAAAAVDDEHLRLIDALDLRSFVGVPLKVAGKVLGAITFVMAESHRKYGEADLEFARALADRAALAIDNARLFQEVEQARAATAAQLVDEGQRRRAAEEQARFAETFVGILGHDLRNPLNAIVITTRLLRRRATAPNELSAIDRVQSSALRMSNMVGQLLDLTRSRIAGGISLERQPTDLSAVVSEVVDELRRAYPGRQIAWTGDNSVAANADRDRLAQVFSNLVGNALEHGDPAQPVTVRLSGEDGSAVLTVHNEGPPISPDLLPVLFEPFRRNIVRNERSRGLGLGLYITAQIVEAHGGHVDLASTTERGTTFTIVLPRHAADVDDAQVAAPRRHLVS